MDFMFDSDEHSDTNGQIYDKILYSKLWWFTKREV